MLKKHLLTVLLISLASWAYGESYKVRQLLGKLKNTNDNDKKIEILINIASELKGSLPDSALYYFSQAEKMGQSLNTKKKQTVSIKIMIGRASVQIAKGNYKEAWSLDSVALYNARRLKDREQEAAALLSQGGIYYNQSKFDLAQKLNNEALQINRTTSDRKTEGKILTNIGTIEFMLGNTRKADSLFKIPLLIAQKLKDDDLLAASYLNIGLLNIYSGNYDDAEKYLKQSEQIYKSIDGKDGLVLCYQNLSNIWFGKGNFGKTIEYDLLNQDLSVELGDKTGLSKAYQNLGECHSQIGDYEKALEYFIKGLKIKTTLGDKKGIAATNSSIGHIHYMRGDKQRALEYYRKSLHDNTEINYALGIAASNGDIGTIMAELNKNDSALIYFKKSEEVYLRNDNLNFLSNIYLNIGKTCLALKNYASAEDFISKAEKIKLHLEDKIGIYNAWSLFSSIHFDKYKVLSAVATNNKHNDWKCALNYALKAHQLADSMHNLPEMEESAAQLIDIYSAVGNSAEALKYAKQKIQASDSLSLIQREEALVNAETRWKSEKKQAEIEVLQQEKALQNEVILQKDKLASRLILLLATILLILILITLLGILYFRFKNKSKDVEYQKKLNEIIRLKMQNIYNRLSPHFFFNILNDVAGEVYNPEKVREKINQTSILLRMSLEWTDHTSIPLTDEIQMVKSYIALLSGRIPGPFEVIFHITDTIDSNQHIPPMMLQIVVENAIKHGLLPLEGSKFLSISISQTYNKLQIIVEDNGVGREQSKDRTTGTGTGLKVLLQTIRLLNQQNTENITFNITDNIPRGTIVTIIIPLNYSFQLPN